MRKVIGIGMALPIFGNLAKVIRPNMERYEKIMVFLQALCAVGVGVAFVAFGATAAYNVINFKFNSIFYALIPFFCFPLCGVLMILCRKKLFYIRSVNKIIQQVKYRDKALIAELCGASFSEMDMVVIINKLIETGNLAEYNIVANIMVVKNSVYMDENMAKNEQNIYNEKSIPISVIQKRATTESAKFCVNCGAALVNGERFCPKCGSRNHDFDA